MDTPHDLTAVESLLAERDALHGWLTRLDDAGSTVPESVRARVRVDYEQRMDAVTARLGEHGDTITRKLDDDRNEHRDLLARATAAREALAEAELRFAVGEYDQSRFDAERTSHASDIESYDLSLTAAAERIARLEEVHSLVTRAPQDEPAPHAGRAPESEVGAPVFHGAMDVDEPEIASDILDDVPAYELLETQAHEDLPAIGIGELAPDDAEQLLAIFDEVDVRSEGPAPHDGHGPLSFRPSGTTDEHATMRVAPRHHEPQPVAPVAPPAPVSVATAEAVQGNTAARTARCGECGAMNRPTEWYCEKCGAELSVV